LRNSQWFPRLSRRVAQPLNLCVYPPRKKVGAPSFATESRGRFLREIRSGAKGGIVQSARAKTTDTHLWPGRLALHYLLLLSPTSVSALQIAARPLPENSGRNQKEIPVYGRRLCGHAEHFHLLIGEVKLKSPSAVMQVLKQRVPLKCRGKKRRPTPVSTIELFLSRPKFGERVILTTRAITSAAEAAV
jgi:hypothetical protein